MNRRHFINHSLIAGTGFWALPFSLAPKTWNNEDGVPVIIDADTANEVDDLYAIAGALLSPNLNILGLTSAQWHTNPRVPNDSVGASQQLNEDILRLMNKTVIPHPAGSNFPMTSPHRAQPSDAADFIIKTAMEWEGSEKINVVILGPATNLASAIVKEPGIIPKIRACYLGFWFHPETNTWSKREFNTNNDPNAVNALIDTHNLDFRVMTASTSQHLIFKKSKVDAHLKGRGGIGDYLVKRWDTYDRFWQETDKEKTKWIMWDVAILEALAHPEWATIESRISPHDNLARPIDVYTKIDVEAITTNYWQRFDDYFK